MADLLHPIDQLVQELKSRLEFLDEKLLDVADETGRRNMICDFVRLMLDLPREVGFGEEVSQTKSRRQVGRERDLADILGDWCPESLAGRLELAQERELAILNLTDALRDNIELHLRGMKNIAAKHSPEMRRLLGGGLSDVLTAAVKHGISFTFICQPPTIGPPPTISLGGARVPKRSGETKSSHRVAALRSVVKHHEDCLDQLRNYYDEYVAHIASINLFAACLARS
jgi:hypothetical protein